jgi:hypothetical protein
LLQVQTAVPLPSLQVPLPPQLPAVAQVGRQVPLASLSW